MSARSWALLVALASTPALAQTAAVSTTDLSRGATLLPGSLAWADEASALVYNPAGLNRSGTFNGLLFHERSNTRGLDNNGLWLATSLGDVVGSGVSFEWLRSPQGTQRAKSSWGFSAGSDGLSIGAGLNWFWGPQVDGLFTADVGIQSRPLRWLSMGALVRNLNAPSRNGTSLAREWGLGLGLRPFEERFTVGVDWYAAETLPVEQSRLQYTLAAEVVKGLRVLGGVSHGFGPTTPLFIQAGLTLDLENVGYTQGVAFEGAQANFQYALRFSADKYASLVPKKKIAVLSLDDIGEPAGSTVGSLLGIAAEDRFLKLLRTLDRASRDPELTALVIKVEGASLGLARADELRSAILALRAAGKKVYAYLLSVGDPEYLIASACDALYGAPESMFMVDGLRSSVTYFGGALEKLGITVDVARVGKYKNSPDQLTRHDMSPEQREALEAYLDTAEHTVAARIGDARGLKPEAWRALVDEGLKSVRRAQAQGLIDGVLDPHGFDELLKERLPGATVDRGYQPFDGRDTRWGPGQEIAIIPVLGTITGGSNRTSPVGGVVIAGAQSFIESITRAAQDDDVKAIVVRVDSGGGDGLASYLMYRAVLEAKKRKPVVVSMGDTAASGGYYVSAGADEIWASPTTLTGSIGVFFMKPAVEGLANKLGITQETLSRGKQAGITDYFAPWSEDQRHTAQQWVDDFYDTFITEVAVARGLKKDAVDTVARGRVWSGADAQAHGLVDHLGGLMDAVRAARRRAHLGDEAEVDLVIDHGRSGLLSGVMTAAPEALLDLALPSIALPPALQPLAAALGPDSWLLGRPTVQARLEYDVQLR